MADKLISVTSAEQAVLSVMVDFCEEHWHSYNNLFHEKEGEYADTPFESLVNKIHQ